MLDHVAQEIAPQLYAESDPRILDKDAEIQYENGVVRAVPINDELCVVSLAPEGVTPENAKGIATFQSGYTTSPTSILTDAFAKPLLKRLAEIESIAVFWAPYGRGTENAIQNQGRWSAEKIRKHIAAQLHEIFEHFKGDDDARRWIGGHSMGGQMNLNIFASPWQYDFNHKSFDGALAYSPVSSPCSQMILLRKDGVNWPIFNDLLPKGLVPVLKSLLTGKGVELGEEKGEKFFFEDPLVGMEEVTRRLFPDSGRYFLQTITTGSSLPAIGAVRDKRIGLMSSAEDRIVSDVAMCHTYDGLVQGGANVRCESVRGDHFSAFYKSPDGGDPDELIQKHKKLFEHVLRLD